MNESTHEQFSSLVEQVVRPITASQHRKQTMREELLLHLTECQLHELKKTGEEHSATEAATRRFGDIVHVRRQLQASVPLFERAFHRLIDEEETRMSRILWVVSIVAIVIGVNFSFRYREEVHFAGVGLLTAMIIRHLCRKDNLAERWVGPRWPWVVGFLGIVLGPSLILPAAKRLNLGVVHTPALFMALAIGVLIVLAGIGFFAYALTMRRARIA